jgi:hypothetical protein
MARHCTLNQVSTSIEQKTLLPADLATGFCQGSVNAPCSCDNSGDRQIPVIAVDAPELRFLQGFGKTFYLKGIVLRAASPESPANDIAG